MMAPRGIAEPPRLVMKAIGLSFGSVRALRGVDFELRRGEVMALLGENGAGKSTLVKILAGLHAPDAGSISVDGTATDLSSPRRSHAAGIAVAEQELSVIGPLTAAENVFLGGVPFSGAWSLGRLSRAARPHLDAVGLGELDPLTRAEELSVAERQLVEIARLLARDAQILILDEPTAALSDREIERVKATVTRLAGQGRSVVYVTHRLGEVFEIADRVTVLRNGRSEPAEDIAALSMDDIVTKMIGRELDALYPPRSAGTGSTVIEVSRLQAEGLASTVDLTVRAGEILGVAGQIGSGNGPLLRAMAGAAPDARGTVAVCGTQLPPAHTIKDAIAGGLAYCSSDRKLDGIFGQLSIRDNLTAPALTRITPRGLVNRRREDDVASDLAGEFSIDVRRLTHCAGTLSGGNQQKVALGKWMGVRPLALLVEEPTRGVDVGARAEIYAHLRRLADSGLAIVFASSDLEEVLGLADTVATCFRGHIVRIAPADALDAAQVLRDITSPQASAPAMAGGAA